MCLSLFQSFKFWESERKVGCIMIFIPLARLPFLSVLKDYSPTNLMSDPNHLHTKSILSQYQVKYK